MADRIKGITIEIGGDTTKLSDSLKDVNKSIKDTQAELKDVDKLLKLDPSNIELLGQKQDLLTKAIGDTKEKLDKLKEAQAQMKASGVDETSEQYRALEREIIATEQEMKKLGDEALKTDKKILGIVNGSEKLAKSTDKMAKATKGLSKAASGALVGLVGMGIKAAKDADDLNTLAKQTGLSTEALQKMQYASDLIDVNVDDITSSFTKMKKQLDSGADKFEAIGVHTKDINGNLRDSETVFYETIRALGQIGNETERDVAAMEIFGKSADELAGLIDDGGEAFRRLGDQAKANGSIISQEELDKANKLNDELDKMKAELGASLSQVGIDIAQALLPLIQDLTPVLQDFANWLKEINPETVKIVAAVLGVIAVLSPLLTMISKIIAAVGVIAPVLASAGTAISGIVAVLTGPVIAAIGLVLAAIAIWIQNWDEIKLAFQLAGEIILEVIENIKKKFSEWVETIKNTIDTVKMIWKTMLDFLFGNATSTIDKIKNAFKTAFDIIKAILKSKLEFPKIKIPHFSVEGKLSLNPPSVPKIKVDWFKKAYDDAYLLNSPTIFGASGGQLLGGGEGNGSEAVVGTDKLMSMMADVVGNQNITVVLEGDAQGVFNLVRTENSRFMKTNGGYSPLLS